MKFSFDLRSFLFPAGLGLVANIITWLIIRFKIHPTAEILPLHYNIFYGTDFAGKGYYIYSLPLIGFLILAINVFFYFLSRKRELFAGQLLLGSAVLVQLIILIAALFLKSIIVT